jgi:hypothetical protein
MAHELISCHDCGWSVSFSAAACPNCGSSEPSGPYRHNRKDARRLGAEDKNDLTLILMTVGLGAVGAFYGFETSSSSLGAIVLGLCYGFVGAAVGMLLASTLRGIGVRAIAAAKSISGWAVSVLPGRMVYRHSRHSRTSEF